MISHKPKILCVDDEYASLLLFDALLAPKGYECILAKSGSEALDIIKAQKIDAVILDVMMPEIDGFEICRTIKNDERLRRIPVIMVTALRAKEERLKSIQAGADDFISKPVDKAEVLSRINAALKMKAQDERLNLAYSNMIDMISFGEGIIKTFKPVEFNLTRKIDSIAEHLIRHKMNSPEKPLIIIAGIYNKQWEWHKYEYIARGLEKKAIDFDIAEFIDLPVGEETRIRFLNREELMKYEFTPFIKRVEEALSLRIFNMVSCLSSDICFFAMNYGISVTGYDAKVLESFITQSLFLRSLSDKIKVTEDDFFHIVSALARVSESIDGVAGNHILRVGEYSAAVAGALGMPASFVNEIRIQARLHDVGKIQISPFILKKPHALTAEEFESIKKHTIYGAKIIESNSRLDMAKEIALTHHERWDGSGYPNSLRGEDIPLSGRIISIADQYDAIRNQRPHKPAFDHETTGRIITQGDGRTMPSHFDPQVLETFKNIHKRFEEIYESHKD